MQKKYIFYNICVILAVLVFYYIFDINCPVKRLTGLPCAGCGMSRAIYSFCIGNVKEAFRFHPLFPLAPIVMLTTTNFFDKYKKIKHTILSGIFIMFFSVYIIRMYFYFPDTPPMDLYENAVILKIINFLKVLVLK